MVNVIPCTLSKSYYELILIYNFEEKYYTTCSDGAKFIVYSIFLNWNRGLFNCALIQLESLYICIIGERTYLIKELSNSITERSISITELSYLIKDKKFTVWIIDLCNWIKELSIWIKELFNTIRELSFSNREFSN